nr:lysine N(6)-hydroxylase/L-ornithine N(5)-oxygenase family protein [Paraburkholderia phenoliruptrix]
MRPHQEIKARFFDKRSEFQWHSGLMLPQAALQVPYLKDLVSLVDPTNELSFLSFLAKHKRLLCLTIRFRASAWWWWAGARPGRRFSGISFRTRMPCPGIWTRNCRSQETSLVRLSSISRHREFQSKRVGLSASLCIPDQRTVPEIVGSRSTRMANQDRGWHRTDLALPEIASDQRRFPLWSCHP